MHGAPKRRGAKFEFFSRGALGHAGEFIVKHGSKSGVAERKSKEREFFYCAVCVWCCLGAWCLVS